MYINASCLLFSLRAEAFFSFPSLWCSIELYTRWVLHKYLQVLCCQHWCFCGLCSGPLWFRVSSLLHQEPWHVLLCLYALSIKVHKENEMFPLWSDQSRAWTVMLNCSTKIIASPTVCTLWSLSTHKPSQVQLGFTPLFCGFTSVFLLFKHTDINIFNKHYLSESLCQFYFPSTECCLPWDSILSTWLEWGRYKMVLSLIRSLVADIASTIVNSQASIVEQHPGTGLACWVQKAHCSTFPKQWKLPLRVGLRQRKHSLLCEAK